MNSHVCWMFHLTVGAGRENDLGALMEEMVAATRANEPGTLEYEWSLSADGTQCHLWERYADSAAAMIHIGTFGSTYAGRFFDILTPVSFTLYGTPDAQVREALAGSAPVLMQPLGGFCR